MARGFIGLNAVGFLQSRQAAWLMEPTPMSNLQHLQSELKSPVARYGLAMLSVLVATLVRLPFEPLLRGKGLFELYYLPVVLVAWYCGTLPTIVTTLLSLGISCYYLLAPERSWKINDAADVAALVLFLLVCAALTGLSRAASRLRRRAEHALAVAHRAQSAANAAMWELDEHGAFDETGELGRLFGLARAGALLTIDDLRRAVHPDDRVRLAQARRAALEKGTQINVEFRIHHSSLGERWLMAIGEAVREPSERPVRMAGVMADITDRKRGELALARLAAIVESSEDAIVSKSLDGTIRSWNPAAQRLFGYTAEEAIGQSILILIPPERAHEEAAILERIRAGQRLEHFETVRRAKDGRLIDISLTVSPVRDSSGDVIGVSKTARDITQRKRSEQALAVQREWFRVTLSSIGDGVIASDREGRITFMNPCAESLTGWTAKQAEGKPLADILNIINETTRERVENPCKKVMTMGRVLGLANHTVLVSGDGAEHPIADSAAPILDGQGNILGAVFVFHDVTEQRRAAAALAEQREWFETTLSSIGDAVIATDINRRVTFMNPVAEYLTGWRFDRAKDRNFLKVFQIINEQTRKKAEDPVSRVLREGVVVGVANHTVLNAADGSERPVDDSGAPIRDRDGRIIGVVLVFRDVTERHRAEKARQAMLQEREHLLASERTARADAERANRLKDEFVAMLSHELRTPLTPILGWTELLQRAPADAELVRKGLVVIERNTRAQSQLVSDLLDVSRIIAGKLRLDMQPVDLASVVRAAVETLSGAAEANAVQIRLSLDGTIDRTVGDPARLQQVVWNLMTNAVKFTPARGHIDVTLRRAVSTAEIVVTDSGIGIEPEFLSNLFERFSQAESSVNRRFGGLGLGLSIVRELVQMHGGTVTAESAGEGRGASFTVRLPIIAPETPSAGHRAYDIDSTEQEIDSGKLHGLEILVVEDEPDTRDLIKRILERYGAIVSTSSNGLEALEMFEARRPSILVSDIGLPEIDGYELIRRIRARGRSDGGAIPAIALTAFAGAEDRARALRAGYQAHVPKPIEAREFVAVVASFIDPIARA